MIAAANEIAGMAVTVPAPPMAGTATHATGVVPVMTASIRHAKVVTTATTVGGRALVTVMSVTAVTIAAARVRGATGAGIAATETAATAQPAVGPGVDTETTTPPPLASADAAAAVAGRAAAEAPDSVNTTADAMVTTTVTGAVRLVRAAAAIAAAGEGEAGQRLPATRMGLDPPRPHRRDALNPKRAQTTVAAVLATAAGRLAAHPVRAAPAATDGRPMTAARGTVIAATDTAAMEAAAGTPCLRCSKRVRSHRALRPQMPAQWCCSGARLRP